MAMEIFVSVILLFVGIAVLVLIHVCIVGRAFGRSYNNGNTNIVAQRISRSPSMSQDDIKKLPCFDYKVEEKGTNSPMECAVCLENFKLGDKCRLLPNCMHSFHAQCVDSWLVKTGACPICRRGADSLETSGQSSIISSEIGVELT